MGLEPLLSHLERRSEPVEQSLEPDPTGLRVDQRRVNIRRRGNRRHALVFLLLEQCSPSAPVELRLLDLLVEPTLAELLRGGMPAQSGRDLVAISA